MSSTLPVPAEGLKASLPTLIESARENASRYALASKADSSKRAYASDWAIFTAWAEERGTLPMPAPIEATAAFLADSAKLGLKVSTIRRRAAAIGYFHRLAGHESPTASELVRAVLSGIAREHGSASTRKAPASADVIRKMLRHAPAGLGGLRDQALLLVGFAGAFRRSELCALELEDLDFTDRGVLVTIRRSKTDQQGEGRVVAIPKGGKLRALEAMNAWIAAAGIENGPLFRNVSRSGRVGDSLTPRSVADIIKRYAEAAGLDPAIFSGHSLRAGFVTSAFEHGADAYRIMDVTGHREVKTLKVYDRRSKFEKHAGRSFL